MAFGNGDGSSATADVLDIEAATAVDAIAFSVKTDCTGRGEGC